jgi:hypothetical protein
MELVQQSSAHIPVSPLSRQFIFMVFFRLQRKNQSARKSLKQLKETLSDKPFSAVTNVLNC